MFTEYFEKFFDADFKETERDFWIREKGASFASVHISKSNGKDKLFLKVLKSLRRKWTIETVYSVERIFSLGVSVLAYSNPSDIEEFKAMVLYWMPDADKKLLNKILGIMLDCNKKVYKNVHSDYQGNTYNSIEFKGNQMKVQQFFKTDLCDYASYSTVRQIASYIDGLKNGSRKVIYTVLEQNIVNKLKVLQLSNKSAEYADYLHGSLDGVVVSLGAGYVGTNNVPLIQSYGNFGTRLAPEAAAPRYIFGCAHDNLFKIFDKNDCAILDYQTFEGARIEPKFYVPNLPMLLVNGSSGLATGFRQDILPRNPENLKKYCQKLIEGKVTKKDSKLLTPWIKGFNGDIVQDPENPLKFLIRGKLDRTDKTKLTITEMPLGFDYNQAIKHFDKLVDNKVIMDYDDLCDTKADKFKFIVKMSKADLDKFTYDELIEKLKLQVTYTEILCTLDENLKVRTFDSVEDIVKAYLNVKLEYLKKRKLYLEEKISNDIAIAQSKYEFIKRIVQGTLVVQKKKKEVIIKELEKIDVIVQKDGSYDYLLSMPIYSLTKEKMDALQEQLKSLKSDLTDIKGKTPEIMFIDDLNKISF